MKATEVTAGLAESSGSLLPGLWRDSLHVTCGLTACTPGSAPGPTLGNEYGKTLPLPPPCGHFGITRSVRLCVPSRSCLGYRHAGCLQLSHLRPPEMCGLRTRPRTDVDPPRFLPPSNCHRRGGAYRLASPGVIPCSARGRRVAYSDERVCF